MIQISNIKLPPAYTEEDIRRSLQRMHIPADAFWNLQKLSLDARKKESIHYLASVQASWPGEREYLKRCKNRDIGLLQEKPYQFPSHGERKLRFRPVIAGAGPAGLFAARVLAEAGYAPILLERGAPVEERSRDVEAFWKGGCLKPDSNVQFGEGGAGTFSDGKLMTQTKDREGRIRQMLTWFVDAGASPEILWWNKPHIGTDVLKTVVRNLREEILAKGGEVRFHSRLDGLGTGSDGSLHVLRVVEESAQGESKTYHLETEVLLLCIGHSARDTFRMLDEAGVPMEAKAFAVGVRIEHPQKSINLAQYGREEYPGLPAADYKLTEKAPSGRGVYSFCMCPGGQVVNASSEAERIAVNGMSRAARDGRNANSALVVQVSPADFGEEGPLAGIAFQRRLEHLAWETGEGKVPVQLLGDFRQDVASSAPGDIEPDLCGAYSMGNLRPVLPGAVSEALLAALPSFGRKIAGYDRADAVLSGVESRTSSPVRIPRDAHFESSMAGLFPCGEGAGYAGGITSAAVDGMKCAEEIIRRYQPF